MGQHSQWMGRFDKTGEFAEIIRAVREEYGSAGVFFLEAALSEWREAV